MEILSAAFHGLGMLFTWPVLLAMMSGILIGMCVGLIPGLGGLTGMALLLPFAIGQSPEVGFAFLLGMYAVTTQTDAIPAILLGMPGTVSATATALDGYPMAKRGEAGRALSVSYMASITGAAVSGLIILLVVPMLRPILLQFASPELFMLSMLGMVIIGSMVSGDVFRGLVMAGMGLFLAMIGLSPGSGMPRFVFGQPYLWDGVPLIPLVLGLFAVPELLELAAKRVTIARIEAYVTDGRYSGFWDIISHRWLVLRCSVIGSVIGLMPGLGGPVAEWFGYGHAVHSAKNPSLFGKGDVRGVIAPETSTGAQKPGSILPTIAFGIPGNPAMALLLGVFIMGGLQPGPNMLSENLDITFLLVWVIVIANTVAAALALGLHPMFVRLCYIRSSRLVPVVLGFMVIGASTATGDMGDLIAFGVFGVLGILFKSSNWPRVPLMMGLVLGKIAEPYLFITVDRYGAGFLWSRPVVIVVEILMIAIVAITVRRKFSRTKLEVAGEATSTSDAADLRTPGPAFGLSFLLTPAMGVIGGALAWSSMGLPLRERLFPLVVGSAVVLFATLSTISVIARVTRSRRLGANTLALGARGGDGTAIHDLVIAVGWLGVLLVSTYLAGHMIAIPLFILVYMLFEKERFLVGLATATISAIFIHFVFTEWLNVTLPVGRVFLLTG